MEQNAVGQNDSHSTCIFQMIEAVKQKCVVCFGLRRKHTIVGETAIIQKSLCRRPLCGVWRIHQHHIEIRFFVSGPVRIERISITKRLIFGINSVQKHIHSSEVVCGRAEFLTEIADIVGLMGELSCVQQQRPEPIAASYTRSPCLSFCP